MTNAIEQYRAKFGTKAKVQSTAIDEYRRSRGIVPKVSSNPDLNSTEGLYGVAQRAGGAVAERADEITGKDPGFFSQLGGALKTGLGKVLDVAQRFNYAGASAVKNVIDDDAETTFGGGLKSGITGQTKHTYTDVFEEAGWNPETKLGKFGKGAAGFALDVLLDPTTYVTFGASAGVKVSVAGSTKVLSKSGNKLLAKGVAQKSGQEFGEQFVKDTIGRMAEKSPEMYKKFIDQGGIKFFGKSIISGGSIAGVTKMIPGMTKLDEATLPVRNTLYALFNRDASAKFGKLENLGQIGEKVDPMGAIISKGTGREFVQMQQKFRDLGYVRSQEAVDRAVDIAKANKLTSQEAEFITNAIETRMPLSDERLENARKLLEQGLGRNLKDELKAGIEVGDLPNYVPHILLDSKSRNIPFKPTGVRVSLGATKGRTIGKLGEEGAKATIGKGTDVGAATIAEINSAFGKDFFDPNIINTAAIRSVASARAVTSREFLTEVAQKFGTDARTAPTGYIESGAKELKGLKFHPAIVEQIDKFGKSMIGDDATNNLLRAFDKAQNFWKASVTSIFPAFHGRNAMSNVFLNFLDIGSASISPSKHVLATSLLNQNRQATNLARLSVGTGEGAKVAKIQLEKLLNKTVLTDDFGKSWTFKEIRKELTNRRVAFGGEFTGFLDIREGLKDKIGKLAGAKKTLAEKVQPVNLFSQNNLAFRAGRAAGNIIEQQARVLNFITNLERTGDVVTSAERTKQFLFDYTNLSDFEKNVMRRLIPFYTFTRKNLELQVGQLAKQPGKLATQAKIFTNVSKMVSGGQLSEDETKKLPQFLQEGLGIVYKREGNKVEMINSLGIPIEQIFANLKPNAILGSLSPAIAVPLQAAIGKHFFFDKDLNDVNNATAYKNAPQAIKDYIGFTVRKNKDGTDRYIALNPTRLFVINNIPPLSRVVSVIGNLEDTNVSGNLKALRILTGLKPYGQDLDEQAKYQEKKKMRELQDMLDDSGVAPIFKRSFIPKEN